MFAKGNRQRHIAGVATVSDKDAADPSAIVTRIERKPATAEVNLHPGAKVHRIRRRGNADIAEIAGDIASRNVQTAAKRDSQVRKIPTHTNALAKGLQSRAIGSRLVIVEFDMLMNEITDCLDTLPAGLCRAKFLPGEARYPIHNSGSEVSRPLRPRAV